MIVIVVVNLGIRYLSFVYIFKDKFDKVRELSVFCSVIYKQWISGSDVGFFFYKIFICFFLNLVGNFDLFGYLVEEKYSVLMNDNVYNGWKFFKYFKMFFLNEKVDRILFICYYK